MIKNDERLQRRGLLRVSYRLRLPTTFTENAVAFAASSSGKYTAEVFIDIEILVSGRKLCMNIAGVHEALHRQPFEPFDIRLADGRALSIRHPDFVALGKRWIVIIGEDDSTTVIEPLLIVSLDSSPKKRGKRGNGTPKKRRKS